MILRRVMEHVRAQNWFAVAIDFVIVVAGVFVGLQVNNWNEARADKRHYQTALGRLHDEISANIDTIDLAEADLAAELPVVRRAHDALETCTDDDQTRLAVNEGLALLTGSNGLQLRSSELSELASAPRLLAQQTPTVRRRLADLLFFHELAARSALDSESYPLENRPENISVLRPGPRSHRTSTYLGITINADRRSLQLNSPISAACTDSALLAALWAWDRSQSNLLIYTQKMRQEYRLTLDLLAREVSQ